MRTPIHRADRGDRHAGRQKRSRAAIAPMTAARSRTSRTGADRRDFRATATAAGATMTGAAGATRIAASIRAAPGRPFRYYAFRPGVRMRRLISSPY